ncbi:MAG: DNA methyltransferase, partial [Thermoplasmata archaeon]
VSMKPLSERSYVEQALKNRKGITWLDDCRIPYVSEEEYEKTKRGVRKDIKGNVYAGGWKSVDSDLYHDRRGRFPPNLLVSDNVLDIGINQKSHAGIRNNKQNSGFLKGLTPLPIYVPYSDEGDLSRYFSLDAWWEQKVKDLPEEMQKIFPFLYVPKASKTERNKGIEGITGKQVWADGTEGGGLIFRENIVYQNFHPTVKPIKITSYLITLTTREGDVVLDPFIGSGTTAISSILLNRKFIGFERDPEYFKIAEARIKYYQAQKKVMDHE